LLFPILAQAQTRQQWTTDKAQAWQKAEGFRVGANFLPSSAINQLEMWQKESWDPKTVDKELGWAAAIGMNVMRVYLHDIAWETDADGFLKRMDQFLGIADKHRIKILFTVFDDCWNPDAKAGKQPDPKPGIHNSGWVRSPNKALHDNAAGYPKLEAYVKAVLTRFRKDQRIYMWDLYNEPGNSGYGMGSMPLLKQVFSWAWSVRPSQPLTVGVWFQQYPELNRFQLDNSDVISFHNYDDTTSLKKALDSLKAFGRPIVCTEYMARTRGSRFETHLPIFKRYGVTAINWGLVAGKSNTIYQWDTPMPDGAEPKLWFHDVFRKDGSAYSTTEVEAIRRATAK
jgi:endo-1,4-beta-mannosidase